jgi:hypothetical protein
MDFYGTLSCDGQLYSGVKRRLLRLAAQLELHVWMLQGINQAFCIGQPGLPHGDVRPTDRAHRNLVLDFGEASRAVELHRLFLQN